MALESGTYISDLNTANPTSSDPKSQGDDHIRLLKSTIKTTFPNINGAVSASDEELSAVAGVLTASLGGNGYQKLPGGLILQWGNATSAGSGGQVTITFPTAFPTAVYTAVAMGSGNSATSCSVWRENLTTTTLLVRSDATAGNIIFWIALGK